MRKSILAAALAVALPAEAAIHDNPRGWPENFPHEGAQGRMICEAFNRNNPEGLQFCYDASERARLESAHDGAEIYSREGHTEYQGREASRSCKALYARDESGRLSLYPEQSPVVICLN